MDAILSYDRRTDDNYYTLLGCDETASTEQILAEFKARVLEVHPDKNPDDPLAEERFKKLQLAKETLTVPEKRKQYDTWLQNKISVPFEQWSGLGKNVHTSLHWASRKKKDLMLEGSSSSSSGGAAAATSSQGTKGRELSAPASDRRRSEHWERDRPGEMLRKFRNYEI